MLYLSWFPPLIIVDSVELGNITTILGAFFECSWPLCFVQSNKGSWPVGWPEKSCFFASSCRLRCLLLPAEWDSQQIAASPSPTTAVFNRIWSVNLTQLILSMASPCWKYANLVFQIPVLELTPQGQRIPPLFRRPWQFILCWSFPEGTRNRALSRFNHAGYDSDSSSSSSKLSFFSHVWCLLEKLNFKRRSLVHTQWRWFSSESGKENVKKHHIYIYIYIIDGWSMLI